jgi:branched-chain amino acid transport system substrate-binding protein
MRRSWLVGVVVALIVTACGSSSGGTKQAASPSSKQPVKIAFLNIETGPNALPNRHDALQLAIDQINAKGGIHGHPVEYTAYDTGILPASAVTAVQKAVADHPTVMIGFQVSSGVLAAAPALKQSGIPALQVGNDNATDLSKLGVTNLFRLNSTNAENATAEAQYIVSKNPKTVGIFDDSNLAGVQQVKAIKAYLQQHGITNIISREVAQGATDTTEAALAMKGADIITGTGFPVTTALFYKQLFQNGITAPAVMGSDGLTIVGQKLAPAGALAKAVYLHPCDPLARTTPQAKAYAQAFKAKFPADDVLSSSPWFYDSVTFLAAAIDKANGSLDPAAIVTAMGSVSIEGVCGTFHADSEHNLLHTVELISATTGAAVATYDKMPSS